MTNSGAEAKRAGPSALGVSAVVLLWLVAPVFIGFAAYPAACGWMVMAFFPGRVAVSAFMLGALIVSLVPWLTRGWRRALLVALLGAAWLAVSVPYSVMVWRRAKCGAEQMVWGSGLRGAFIDRQKDPAQSQEWSDWLPNACQCAVEADFGAPLGAPGWERDAVLVLSTDPRAFTGELRGAVVGYVLTPDRGPCREILQVVFGDGTVNWIYERDSAEVVRGALRVAEEEGFPSPPGEFVRALERIVGR